MANLPVFFVLCLLSSTSNALGVNLIVYGERTNNQTVTLCGVAGIAAAGLLGAASLNFGPISLAGPLGVVALVLTPILAWVINEEPIERFETTFAVAWGCVLCAFPFIDFGTAIGSDELRAQWQAPASIAIVTLQSAVIAALVGVHLRWGPLQNHEVYMVLVGMSSALVALCLSTFLVFLRGSMAPIEEFLLMIAFTIAGVIYGLSVHYGFSLPSSPSARQNTSRLFAVHYTTGVMMSVLNGGVISKDFSGFREIHYFTFITGLILSLVTVAVTR